MKLPLRIEGHTVRDAENRVIVSALNPCNDAERAQIVAAVNATKGARVIGDRDFDAMLRFKAGAGVVPLAQWVRQLRDEYETEIAHLRMMLNGEKPINQKVNNKEDN